MSKYNSSLVHLVQVVTPLLSIVLWLVCCSVAAGGWSQCPLCLCLGTADSRLGPRSPRLQAPAAACSRGAAACRGLQQPAARCIHWTHPPPAGAQTHNNCFQSLHLTMDPRSNIFPYFQDHIHVYFFGLSPICGTSISGFINLKQLKLQLSEDTGAASGSIGEVSPVHVQNIVTQPVT